MAKDAGAVKLTRRGLLKILMAAPIAAVVGVEVAPRIISTNLQGTDVKGITYRPRLEYSGG